MTNEIRRASVQVTMFGETRTVEIVKGGHDRSALVHGLVATIGRGVARYPAEATLWNETELTVMIEKGKAGGMLRTVDSEGTVWMYWPAARQPVVVRNRQARIVGWANVAGVTNEVDQTRNAK